MLLFLLLCFRFLTLTLIAFLVGTSAALCPNSPQYPQRPSNAFLGFFLLEGLDRIPTKIALSNSNPNG